MKEGQEGSPFLERMQSRVRAGPKTGFKCSVNLVGGLIQNVEKMDINAEVAIDDLSGVYDSDANESDR